MATSTLIINSLIESVSNPLDRAILIVSLSSLGIIVLAFVICWGISYLLSLIDDHASDKKSGTVSTYWHDHDAERQHIEDFTNKYL